MGVAQSNLPHRFTLSKATSAERTFRAVLSFVVLCVALVTLPVRSAFASTLAGEVVGLTDGDTITLLDASKRLYKIRLAGIDAPEKRQQFGHRARQALGALVFRRRVIVEWHKLDGYGRLIGVVRLDSTDVGLELVRQGLAWHYKAFERDQSSEDRIAYAAAELRARTARLGLWRNGHPIPPWEFRRLTLRPDHLERRQALHQGFEFSSQRRG